jgi:hypothetical protein
MKIHKHSTLIKTKVMNHVICFQVKIGTYTPIGLDIGCSPYRTEYWFIKNGAELNKKISTMQRAEPIAVWKIKALHKK